MPTLLIDAHCHLDQLDLTQYDGKLEQALEAARNFDVVHFLCPGVSLQEFPNVLKIAETYADVNCAVALHPSEESDHEPTLEEIIQLANHKEVIAIGETGLDYHYEFTSQEVQRERFRTHVKAAVITGKPLIVHMREASDDCFQILEEEGIEKVGGMMHCFTSTLDDAKRAMALNFYISFSGIVTFNKATELQAVAKEIPSDRILIETDSPYLAPIPKRGKPNEPAFLHYVAEFLANLRGVSYEEFAQQTTDNFSKLFNPDLPIDFIREIHEADRSLAEPFNFSQDD